MARATKFSKLLVKGMRADANTVADVPLTIQAQAGQTGDLLQVLDSAGAVIAKIGPSAVSSFGLGGSLLMARAKYNFAVDGGVQGAITPQITALIPDNAIVIGGILNSTTALTSGGAATIAVGTTAGSSASSIKAATAVASYSADAILATVPVFTAASAFKMTAAGSINITVATADLTTGVLEITVFYFVAAA